MPAETKSMFYVRKVPWHGLGTKVTEAPCSADALQLAGLDWEVVQEPIFTEGGGKVQGYLANVRSSDSRVLGVVTDRYRAIQNTEAFAFTDSLLREGGLSDTTINMIHMTISSILHKAVEWEIIDRNVCDRIATPKRAKNDDEIKFFTLEETKRFLAALDMNFPKDVRKRKRKDSSGKEHFHFKISSLRQTEKH